MRSVALVLSGDTNQESTVTALQLAERLLARGARVAVFAREAAAGLASADDEMAGAIAGLLRRGVHGATLDWVVDGPAASRRGAGEHASGVVVGGSSDLWTFVHDADVVLSQPKADA